MISAPSDALTNWNSWSSCGKGLPACSNFFRFSTSKSFEFFLGHMGSYCGADLCFCSPQPDTSLFCKTTNTVPVHHMVCLFYVQAFTGTRLYCMVTCRFLIISFVSYHFTMLPCHRSYVLDDLTQFRITHTHTHTHLTSLCPGLCRWASTRKIKQIWILLKQETVSGSSISWAICKSAPRSRPITMPAPHHSVFTGRMPFLPPNQQCQSSEGSS